MKINAIHLTALDKKLVNSAIDYYKNGEMEIDGYLTTPRKWLKLTNVKDNILTFRLSDVVGGRAVDNTKVTVEL